MRLPVALLALLAASFPGAARSGPTPGAGCLLSSGNATARCVHRYAAAVGTCRNRADLACESRLREGKRLEAIVSAIELPTRRGCTETSAADLTYSLGLDDLVFRDARACETWAENFVGAAYADDLASLSPDARACQRRVARQLRALRERTVRAYGPGCYAKEAAGLGCDRPARDARVAELLDETTRKIIDACGEAFDELSLVSGPSREARVARLVDQVAETARHLAQQAYPPLLAPTGLFGVHPVGVRTLELTDPSRPRPVEPRLLRTEVYYPADAVAGAARDHLFADGLDLGETPAYRDVPPAAGPFPLVVYSHFGGGVRYESAFRLAHLASHGFVVASPDHVDEPNGTFDEAQFENRPLDVSFVIDQLLAFAEQQGHFLEGGLDPMRIGAMGGSFGGYTVTALAVGPFFRGTFTDVRVKAILPQDAPVGADWEHYADDAPAVFTTIAIPVLALGGDSGASVPLAPGNQALFDALVPGPPVMAYGTLHRAVHFTFTDEADFRGAAGGSPAFLPPRYAARIVGYLAVSFFEAVLNGDADALDRLEPAALSAIDELALQRK